MGAAAGGAGIGRAHPEPVGNQGGDGMIYVVIALLGVGCAYLGLGLLVDKLLRPMERRWRR